MGMFQVIAQNRIVVWNFGTEVFSQGKQKFSKSIFLAVFVRSKLGKPTAALTCTNWRGKTGRKD